MRILALDPGTKRIGLALSDETQTIAQPAGYIPAKPLAGFFRHLKSLIDTKSVELIVVGMPRNMDGSYGPSADKVRRFIEILQKEVRTPVKTWDERLTSARANRSLIEAGVSRTERKEKADATAAAILLQSYLDSAAEAFRR